MADAHQHAGQDVSPATSSLRHGGNIDRAPVSPIPDSLLLPEQHSQPQRYDYDTFASTRVYLDETRRPSFQYSYQQDAYDLGRPETQLVSPIMSRSPSIASDRHSAVSGMTATYFANAPADVNPGPAYVAPSGAAQVVAEHRALTQPHASDDEDFISIKDDCSFSPAALGMVNAFLDQLLFSFLYTARSTSLSALRPAVTEILKAKLARDAVASAEEELRELTAGGEEEEEINTKFNTAEKKRKWDLELVWKRTRLRVMVYMRLGEMEDEDEERYVREEHLIHGSDLTARRFSHSQSGLVSWAAAIFLTGVLEHIAEHTLQIAGNAAYSRTKRQTQDTTPNGHPQRPVVVEEYDVEKVALNSGIGRLWRTWRKTLRESSPVSRRQPISPKGWTSLGRESNNSYSSLLAHHRRGSASAVWNDGVSTFSEDERPMMLADVPEMEFPEHVLASNIPLPLENHAKDVDEIEVPGLAKDPDEPMHNIGPVHVRRNSFTGGLPTPDKSPVDQHSPYQRPLLWRKRSTSMPTPAATPLPGSLPGSYPEDVETSAQEPEADMQHDGSDVADVADVADGPGPPDNEQKFSAQEMAAHKRASLEATPFVERSNGAPPQPPDLQSDRNEHHGLIGGAIAGASAVPGAAIATISGFQQKDEEEIVPVSSEDVDRRKSLINLKDIIAAASSDAGTPRESATSKSSPPIWDRNVREDPARGATTPPGTDQQGAAGALSTLPSARRQRMQEQPLNDNRENLQADDIGVARTSDVMVPSPRSWTPTDQQARDGAKRSTRLVLGDTTPHGSTRGSESSVLRDSPKGSPRNFSQGRDVSQTWYDVAPVQNEKAPHPRSTTKQEKRRSIPGLALSSAANPAVARNSYRQSWGTALQQQKEERYQERDDAPSRPVSVPGVAAAPALHKGAPPQNTAGVQEHPVLSRMASMKHHRGKSESSPISVEASEAAALTSASIRGPEDFDMFVQGADTVKYTLTPQAVRDTPIRVAEVLMKQVQPAELSSAPSFSRRTRGPAPPPIDTSDHRTGRSSTSKQATSATPEDESPFAKRRKADRRSVSKPPARNVSAHSRSGLMAREPRVQTESTRDFADFIRSTGPSKEEDAKPFFNAAGRSTASLQSLRSAHVHGASRSSSMADSQKPNRQDRSKSVTTSDMAAGKAPPVPNVPVKVKQTMQARGATVGGNSSSDLIDFIRSGPDQAGEHRISRSVAPFRSTMDSDQLKDIGDRINGEQPLDLRLNTDFGSNAGSSVRASSTTVRTSANSRSALLGGNADAVVHPAHSGQQQRLGSALPAARASPERKRYRNKDPYAVDFDDDQDLDLLTALPKNRRQEESLMDFLNSNEPPQDNGPKPLLDGTTQAYITKSGANSTRRSSAASSGSLVASNAPRARGGQAPSSGPRSQAPSLHGQQSPMPTVGSRDGGRPRERPDLAVHAPSNPSRPRLEARDANTTTKTSDLADFFKHSAPPGQKVAVDPQSAPAPSIGRQSKLKPKEAEKENRKIAKNAIANEAGPKQRRSLFSRFGGGKGKTWIEG